MCGEVFHTRSLYKWMLEYTQHVWHEDEACYRAALQVCSDYEDGTLWYIVRLRHAGNHELDPNIDTRPYRRRMYML